MTQKFEIYKCDICGNLIQVVLEGGGVLVCCNEDMEMLKVQTAQEEMVGEKHTPVFEDLGGGAGEIKVGSVPHPMLPEHHIMFVEAIAKDKTWFKLKYLEAGQEPKMQMPCGFDKVGEAKEYCNLHGLWQAQK